MRFGSRLIAIGLFSGAVLALAAEAGATVHNVFVPITGLEETPPNASPGTGGANVSFDDVTGQMIVSSGTFSGMVGPSSDAHVHGFAAPGTPAGVLFPLTFDLGVTSGTFSGSGTFGTVAARNNVMAGLTYINIHSQSFPSGELRGQIIIPEPASAAALALTGLGALTLRRRRK